MAASSPEFLAGTCAARRVCVLACLLGPLWAAPVGAQQQPITLEAASSDFDRRNERLVFRRSGSSRAISPSQPTEAESRDLDFSRGSWSFFGDVRISGPMGEIESDRATISLREHRLTRATAEGAPARFSRTMPEPESRLVTGTASRIDYDLARGELELSGPGDAARRPARGERRPAGLPDSQRTG
jgi:lipopolysaccharide export system protein LptA